MLRKSDAAKLRVTPTVANWVVQAGGMGAYNRNMNNTAGKAANVGGAVAGASTGNVAGVLLKK